MGICYGTYVCASQADRDDLMMVVGVMGGDGW